MTDRQRHLETLLFGNPDKVPLRPGYGRESTREAWLTQTHFLQFRADFDDFRGWS